MMDLIGRGIIAGFLATLVFSLVAEPLALLARASGVSTSFGWLVHVFSGSFVWGAGFALVHDLLRGPSWLRGVLFALASSLLVAALVALLGSCGLLEVRFGVGLLSAALLMHLVYGAILGGIYGALRPEADEPHGEYGLGGSPDHHKRFGRTAH